MIDLKIKEGAGKYVKAWIYSQHGIRKKYSFKNKAKVKEVKEKKEGK